MILDGVDNPDDYYSGAWSTNLLFADEAVGMFFEHCYQAGPKLCSFFTNSTKQIAERFDRVIANLQQRPLPVIDDPTVTKPTLAKCGDLKQVLLNALYFSQCPIFHNLRSFWWISRMETVHRFS